jgi:hypothetical protein
MYPMNNCIQDISITWCEDAGADLDDGGSGADARNVILSDVTYREFWVEAFPIPAA